VSSPFGPRVTGRCEIRVFGDVAGDASHLEGVEDQAGAHVAGELPADDHPGREINHRGQVEPALAGLEVGDVADEPLTWRGGGEVPVDQVRAAPDLTAVNGGDPVGPRPPRTLDVRWSV